MYPARKAKARRRESLPGLEIFNRRERRIGCYVVAMNAEEPQARRPDMGCAQQQQRRSTLPAPWLIASGSGISNMD
jgi:hypothetical protein